MPLSALPRPLAKSAWPSGATDLLVRACLLEPQAAAASWRQWKAVRDLDDTSWSEQKLLVPLARRLADIAPDCPYRPRIEGLAKSHWLTSQLTLAAARPALKRLREAGIAMLLFKGAGFHAAGAAAAARRPVADVDVLLRRSDMERALDALTGDGWRPIMGDSLPYLKTVQPTRIGTNLGKGRHGDIDLHNWPHASPGPVAEDDEELWRRAQEGDFSGCPVLVPCASDQLLLALGHGLRRAADSPALWCIDAAAIMTTEQIDWPYLAARARKLANAAQAMAGLLYLRERIGLPVPESAVAEISRTVAGPLQLIRFVAFVPDRADGSPLAAAARRLLRLPYKLAWTFGAANPGRLVPEHRPLPPLWPVRGQEVPPGNLDRPFAPVHAIEAGAAALSGRARRIVVELVFSEPAQSRRIMFDVAHRGRAIARLRTRAGGRGRKEACRHRFAFALPADFDARSPVEIEALPLRLVRPGTPAGQAALDGPVPFRLERAWLR